MRTVNIHEAKTHLSKLVDQAAKGDAFVIARAGKPLVRVVPIETPSRRSKFNFLAGAKVPDDFDSMFQEEIEEMFGMSEKPARP